MKDLLKQLEAARETLIAEITAPLSKEYTEHGSVHQVNTMNIQSIAHAACSHIDAAICQINILNQHLY